MTVGFMQGTIWPQARSARSRTPRTAASGSTARVSVTAGLAGSLVQATQTATSGLINIGIEGLVGNALGDTSAMSNFFGGLAGQGVNAALGGDFTLNVLNLGFLAGNEDTALNRLLSTGLLEMHLGGEAGFGMNIGTGGVDASVGNLMAVGRGIATLCGSQLAGSKQKETSEFASAMRTWYSGTEEQRQAFDDALNNKLLLRKSTEADFQDADDATKRTLAQTVDNEDGTRTMNIGTAALELGSRMGLNVVFAHEAYRNGKDDGEEGQRAETDRAVEGHVDAALALMAGYGAGSVGGAFMVEAKVYDNARKKNDTETISKIQERYDSSADYWKLMEDGSLKYDGDGWLKDSMGNYILDENKKMIGADAVEGGLINIFKLNDNPENRAIVQKMMKDAGMTELEPKIWWKHDGNMGKAITLDDAAYASIYDKVLFDHNPLNIYSKLVKAGEMIQTPEYQAFTETFRYKAANIIGLGDKVAKLFGVEKYISYDEYKANNFMSGTPVYQTRNTFSDYEVNTLLGATGNLSPNPHRGTDGLVGSGVNSLLLFFNDTSKVVYPPKDNPSDDKKNAQGLYTTIATDITYTFKGKEIKDTVYFRTMHLSEVKVTAGDALTWDTVLGKTGNTGQLTNQQTGKSSGYGNHAHEDIYTNGSPSIYLDYLTRTTPDVMSTVYYKLENNFFYDKFLFADRTKYKIGTNAHLYNR